MSMGAPIQLVGRGSPGHLSHSPHLCGSSPRAYCKVDVPSRPREQALGPTQIMNEPGALLNIMYGHPCLSLGRFYSRGVRGRCSQDVINLLCCNNVLCYIYVYFLIWRQITRGYSHSTFRTASFLTTHMRWSLVVTHCASQISRGNSLNSSTRRIITPVMPGDVLFWTLEGGLIRSWLVCIFLHSESFSHIYRGNVCLRAK